MADKRILVRRIRSRMRDEIAPLENDSGFVHAGVAQLDNRAIVA